MFSFELETEKRLSKHLNPYSLIPIFIDFLTQHQTDN